MFYDPTCCTTSPFQSTIANLLILHFSDPPLLFFPSLSFSALFFCSWLSSNCLQKRKKKKKNLVNTNLGGKCVFMLPKSICKLRLNSFCIFGRREWGKNMRRGAGGSLLHLRAICRLCVVALISLLTLFFDWKPALSSVSAGAGAALQMGVGTLARGIGRWWQGQDTGKSEVQVQHLSGKRGNSHFWTTVLIIG